MTDASKEDLASAFGTDEAAKAKRYIAEIDASERYWGPYWKRCKGVLSKYADKDSEAAEGTTKKGARRFNILWPNIETLKPACYAKVPVAKVARRFKDEDPVARIASEVLERAINYSVEAYDFDQVLKSVRDEYLLLAKGEVWIRYVPTFEPIPQTATIEQDPAPKQAAKRPAASAQPPEPPAERLKYEQVVCDYVAYDDWGTNGCRNWAETRIVWRKVYLGRPALKKRFPRKLPGTDTTIGEQIPLDWKPSGSTEQSTDEFSKAVIYEVCDLEAKKFVWISKGFPHAPLDERDDPLELSDFWPCPKPALGTTTPEKITPIPDYVYYQDQAEELTDITRRIDVLTKAVRMVGIYAGDEKVNLSKVFSDAAENQMIPVDSWQTWVDKGGIRGMVEWVPVEKVMEVLKALYEARDRAKAIVYEITGISDIMRGDTDPEETAAAQGLKSTWGSSRVREKQKEMARLCRDIFRIVGEVIAKRFSINTLRQMTNMQLLTREQKALFEQVAQRQAQPPMPGQPTAPPPIQLTPDQQKLMGLPTWEDVDELLKADGLRSFRIDIESNSTVEPDLAADKRDATEFATAFSGILGAALPVVQAAPALGRVIGSFCKYLARRFDVGTEIEDDIDRAMDEVAGQPAAPPPGQQKPAGGKSPQELAIMQEGNEIRREAVQVDRMNAQADAATNAASVQAENNRIASDERIANLEATVRRMEAMLSARSDMMNGAVQPQGVVQ